MNSEQSGKDKIEEKDEKKPVVIRNATDLQRLRLEKLMKNPVSRKIYIGLVAHISLIFIRNLAYPVSFSESQ